MNAMTTHECPDCGDVHLPNDAAACAAIDPEPPVAAEHTHSPERRSYLDTGGHPVYLCGACGARVDEGGGDWKPRGNYPWG